MPGPTVARLDRRTLGMKPEVTYGTDVFGGTVAQADIQEVFNIDYNVGPQIIDMPFIGGFLGSLGLIPSTRLAQCTFEQYARGAGAVYSASVKPNVDLPFRGCGMEATGDFTASAELWHYEPRSSSFEGMTIYIMQENAPTVKMLGCFGDMQMISGAGRPLLCRYSFIGIYTQEGDTPTLVTKQFTPTPQWPIMLSSAFQVGSENYAPCFANIQMNLNNSMDVQECPNSVGGIGGVFIGGRRPSGSFDPEQATRASFDWIAKWEGSTIMDCTFQSNGAQYARWKASLPKIQVRTRPPGRRGQKATYQVGFDMIPNAGDDEFRITFD